MKATNGRARVAADPMDSLRDDIVALKKDVAKLFHSKAADARGAIDSTISRMKEGAEHAHVQLSNTTAKRPLTTVLIALAAGLIGGKILGWMLRR